MSRNDTASMPRSAKRRSAVATMRSGVEPAVFGGEPRRDATEVRLRGSITCLKQPHAVGSPFVRGDTRRRAARAMPHHWRVFTVVVAAVAMASMDGGMVPILFKDIQATFPDTP